MALKPIIREGVAKDLNVVTNGHGAYKDLGKEFKRQEIVDYSNNEYVNANGFATNNIENYWSTLKRMKIRTHIHVSSKHLPKYIAEN